MVFLRLEMNKAPVAKIAGNVVITLPTDTAELDGSKSSDDKGIVSYLWTRDEGSPAAGVSVPGGWELHRSGGEMGRGGWVKQSRTCFNQVISCVKPELLWNPGKLNGLPRVTPQACVEQNMILFSDPHHCGLWCHHRAGTQSHLPRGGLAMTEAANSRERSVALLCNIAVSFHPTGGVKSLWSPPCPLSFQPGRGNLHVSPEGDWRQGWEWRRPDHSGGETWWVHLVRSQSGIAGSAQQGLDPETLPPAWTEPDGISSFKTI